MNSDICSPAAGSAEQYIKRSTDEDVTWKNVEADGEK